MNDNVLNACSRNGFEQMPYAVSPRSARKRELVASAATCPDANATWARGIAIDRVTVPSTGFQSQ